MTPCSTSCTATLGGGCFWCLDALFRQLQGVERVVSGYSGGSADSANYKAICTGNTGHAEVVQIDFDPQQLSYADLLRVFFASHNPCELNRQGHDVGTQYRSVIFCHDAQQTATAQALINELADAFEQPIVTEVATFDAFYPAETYHQDYYNDNPAKPYCQVVIAPKLAKFRAQFRGQLKD